MKRQSPLQLVLYMRIEKNAMKTFAIIKKKVKKFAK